ncbi:MAG: CPBP family intramembrane metalloprotease [Verrucomicrobia bacterium]|nr:CPBP family intramembrane metalloprotease [Verrucomicrobiota bacterium]
MAIPSGIGKMRAMRNEAIRDFVKVWLYLAATLALGAVVTPWVYNIGKALAEVTAGKQTNGVVEWLAVWCRKEGVEWFFKWSWIGSAVVLFPVWVMWLKVGPGGGGRRAPWSVRLPGGGARGDGGQELVLRRGDFRDGLKGAAVTMALVVLLGIALIQAGAFGWRGVGASAFSSLWKLLPVSLAMAVLQEVLFRGFALGVFLRTMRPGAAILAAALLYAVVGCLVPSPGLLVGNPEGSQVGFEVLAGQIVRLSDPWIIVGVLLPWLAFGGVLGFARWRTRSLWLPVGLHAGWLFANGMFLAVALPLNQPDPIARVLVGATLRDGLIPLLAVALAGIVLHFMTPAAEPDHGEG